MSKATNSSLSEMITNLNIRKIKLQKGFNCMHEESVAQQRVYTTVSQDAHSPNQLHGNSDGSSGDDSGFGADDLDSPTSKKPAWPPASNFDCLCQYCVNSLRSHVATMRQLPYIVKSDNLTTASSASNTKKQQNILPRVSADGIGGNRTVTFIRLPANPSASCSVMLLSTSRLGVSNLLASLLQRVRNSGIIMQQYPVFYESSCHAVNYMRQGQRQLQQLHVSSTTVYASKIINGQECYRPTYCLGKGNFGQVYLCEVERMESTDKRPVPLGVFALKTTQRMNTYKMEQLVHTILQRGHTEESYKSTFLLWMSASLKIVQSGQLTGCLLLELATGGSLQELMAGLHSARRRLAEREAAFYLAETACAIDYMHSRGCIHLDIKADNILLSALGHVRLADFGHSLQLDRHGRARCRLNAGLSTYHLPAEILRRLPLDAEGVETDRVVTIATDWFSYGCLAYWLLHNLFPMVPPSNVKTADDYAHYMKYDGYEKLIRSSMLGSAAYRQLVLELLHPMPGCRPSSFNALLLQHGDLFVSCLPVPIRAAEFRRLVESCSLVPPFVPMPM